MMEGEKFASHAGLEGYIDDFRKGALVAQNPAGVNKVTFLTKRL
jgi:hypothetical protein